MNRLKFVFTHLLPFRCRYWGMPWRYVNALVEKKEWRYSTRKWFPLMESRPKVEYLLRVRLNIYQSWRLMYTGEYLLRIEERAHNQVRKGDCIQIQYRESRICDPLSGAKTYQVRIPPVPQRLKEETSNRAPRPGQVERREKRRR